MFILCAYCDVYYVYTSELGGVVQQPTI